MEKKKLEKGMFGFHTQKKKMEIIKTLILFGIAFAVYFTGLIHTKTNKNLLTVVAIIGMLPASKSAVNMLMFLRYKSAPSALHDQLKKNIADKKEKKKRENLGLFLYDLIFVLNEKVVKTDAIFIWDTTVLVYLTANSAILESEISKQLKNFLSNHGKGKSTVKTYRKEQTFLEQVQKCLQEDPSEQATENQTKIKQMLLGYSM